MYANIKENFLNKQQPTIAQSLARTGIGQNMVQQAGQTTSPWANLIANALNSGLGIYDTLKTNKQNKIADEQANEYSNKIAESLKNKNYDEATALSAGIGDYENALRYADIGQNLLNRQEDNQFRDKQFGLTEQQFAEQQNQNRFNQDLLSKKLELEKQKGNEPSINDLYRLEQLKYNRENMENLKFDRFERTTTGKELAKSRNEATQYINIANSLQNRIDDLGDLEGNITNTTMGRAIDKIASRFGITTTGSLKLDDLRSVNAQIMNEMRQTLKGQGTITDSEAKALPNIFEFTSDGRIVNNIKNFKKYLDSVEKRKIETYNNFYDNAKPRIENQGLNDYYSKMDLPEYLQDKQQNNNQQFVLKKNKNTGEIYKVFPDGSYELQQ